MWSLLIIFSTATVLCGICCLIQNLKAGKNRESYTSRSSTPRKNSNSEQDLKNAINVSIDSVSLQVENDRKFDIISTACTETTAVSFSRKLESSRVECAVKIVEC